MGEGLLPSGQLLAMTGPGTMGGGVGDCHYGRGGQPHE